VETCQRATGGVPKNVVEASARRAAAGAARRVLVSQTVSPGSCERRYSGIPLYSVYGEGASEARSGVSSGVECTSSVICRANHRKRPGVACKAPQREQASQGKLRATRYVLYSHANGGACCPCRNEGREACQASSRKAAGSVLWAAVVQNVARAKWAA